MSRELKPGEQSFAGGAFHPDLEKGRASGTLRVNQGGVFFDTEQATIEFPLNGLKIALGGANDRLIFFTHPLMPEATLHTADHAILKHPALAQHSETKAELGGVRRQKWGARAVVLAVFLLIFGGLAGLWLSKDHLVNAVAKAVPVDWEISLGDKLFNQIKGGKRILEDTNLNAQLAAITTPLLEGIQDSRYPLKFHIVEDSTLNAFAVPGGNVVIHSGLLLAADSPEEVAGVLAHEIAHVNRRHSIRGVISSAGLYVVLQAFLGDATSLLAVIASNGAFLIDRKFSRDFEREADSTGWEYLVRSNIDPRGMIEFFKKMQAEEKKTLEKLPGGGAAATLTFLSTHPATDERMHSLASKWEHLDRKTGFRKFELNYDGFKDSLRSKLISAPDQKATE
jgi:predicted Zn-dependent protease